MIERILQKIEHIRSFPEHIRLRYTLGAVAACMIFVVGVWILTLRQGFLQISPEVSTGKEAAEETLSTLNETLPKADSLRSLKDEAESLRVNNNEGNADDFLNKELQEKNTNMNPLTVPNQESQ